MEEDQTMNKSLNPPARVKLVGNQGKWDVNAGSHYGYIPILWASDLDFGGPGSRSRLGPWGEQKRSSRLGTYDDALANATHVALILVRPDGSRRFYLGVYRVSGYQPPKGARRGSIIIHEQTSMAD
jgi:hypothetical protein